MANKPKPKTKAELDLFKIKCGLVALPVFTIFVLIWIASPAAAIGTALFLLVVGTLLAVTVWTALLYRDYMLLVKWLPKIIETVEGGLQVARYNYVYQDFLDKSRVVAILSDNHPSDDPLAFGVDRIMKPVAVRYGVDLEKFAKMFNK